MTNLDPRDQAALQRRKLDLRWYQARLGFWQAIFGLIISGGIAVAIPAIVDVFKTYQETRLKEQEILLKDKEVTLKDKELEGKILDSHQSYISKFLDTALNQDIELRIRFGEYFSHVSDPKHREGWEKFRLGLITRRDEIRKEINLRELQVDKLRGKQGLSVEEQTQRARLERELSWNYTELGYVRRDSNVSAPPSAAAFDLVDYGKDFNGSLRPVSRVALSNALGEPSRSKETGSNACNPIDNPKLKGLLVELSAESGEKIELIKPAAESLNRIMTTMRRLEPDLAATIAFVPTKCAVYIGGDTKAFEENAWRIAVTLGGQNKVEGFIAGLGIFGAALQSALRLRQDRDEVIEPKLNRLEAIAKYFREERWVWGGGDLIFKRPTNFVVSGTLFDEWVSKGF